MGTDGRELAAQLDRDALLWIWKFGWLRPRELGQLLWPSAEHATKYAERLSRKLLSAGLLLPRTLPQHCGTALVLSQRGAEFLSDAAGVDAKTGKDIGETIDGVWQPPKSWRHDLIANSFLTNFFARSNRVNAGSCFVLPERQLKRENPREPKIPDGIIVQNFHETNFIYWVEVEHARKSGANLNSMAKNLIRVASGTPPLISGYSANVPCVVYCESSIDERGHALNHEHRITSAIKKQADRDIKISFYRAEMIGPAVDRARRKSVVVENDSITAAVNRMAQIGWLTDSKTGAKVCDLVGQVARYYPDGHRWRYDYRRDDGDDEYTLIASGEAGTESEAIRALAGVWLSS